MAILRAANGRQIETWAGLQPVQYRDQLYKAGMLGPVLRARGVERLHLQRAASTLIGYLRTGEVSSRSKVCASRLGLIHYPTPPKGR